MATRSIVFAPGEFYHVYNRGTDKRTIFTNDTDHYRFLERLYVCNSTKSLDMRSIRRANENVFEHERQDTLVSIGAYCLMPNHFHILVTPHTDTGLGTFMNKLGTSYTTYFNKQTNRSGGLFESTYKAKHADSDNYVKYLFAYIHLNPIKLYASPQPHDETYKEIMFHKISQYPYSSLMDHLGVNRSENSILDLAAFPDYFTTHTDIKADLTDWIRLDPNTDKG